MAKSLPTHVAFIRSLSSVDPLMLNKSYVVCEGLPTIDTVKGFLPSVIISPMSYERSILPECFPTVYTLIGSFSSVNSSMVSQG